MIWTANIVVCTAALWLGAGIDYFTGRLPNWLTFSMMGIGVAMWGTWGDPLFALKGIGVAFAIHFVLFALNVVRAGDAKLVMGAGALLGWGEALDLSAWYAAIYLPVGILHLVARRRIGNIAKVAKYQAKKAAGEDLSDEQEPELTQLRTGPVIALAGTIAVFTDVFSLS